MNLALFVFLGLWVGLPIILIISTIIVFLIDRSAKKKMEAEMAITGKKKTRMSQIFFIILLTLSIVSSSLSIGLLILMDQFVKTM